MTNVNEYYKNEKYASYLKRIKAGEINELYAGICGNLISIVEREESSHYSNRNNAQEWLENSFVLFGLNEIYPVECQYLEMNEISTKHVWRYYDDQGIQKFNPTTPCGKIRLELLDKLIELAENGIND